MGARPPARPRRPRPPWQRSHAHRSSPLGSRRRGSRRPLAGCRRRDRRSPRTNRRAPPRRDQQLSAARQAPSRRDSRILSVRDYNADEKIDWHDYYLEALSPVQIVSVKLGNVLFTPLSALLHTVWFIAWFALGLDINLLTLIVSLEAIYITLFIGLGQKLQDKRAEVQAQADKA